MKAKLVYLSGAMLDCTDEECRDWREYAKQNLKCAALDPMIRDYRNRFAQTRKSHRRFLSRLVVSVL
jgi:hypothetical protein